MRSGSCGKDEIFDGKLNLKLSAKVCVLADCCVCCVQYHSFLLSHEADHIIQHHSSPTMAIKSIIYSFHCTRISGLTNMHSYYIINI